MLFDERETTSAAQVVKSFRWPDAGDLRRQNPQRENHSLFRAFPYMSSRIQTTTVHAIKRV